MKPVQVLLAEDNGGDVYLVHEALHKHQLDYALKLVTDADQAIQYLNGIFESSTEPPDIFLLDLNLPKGDGHEVLRQFRQYNSTIPVIVVSSSEAPLDIARAYELGATSYFRKPTDLEDFLRLGALVKELVEKAASQSAE